jgi:hypothetical protein
LLRHWSYTWQKKTPRRSKTLTPWNPRVYKASSHHVTLRKQEGSYAARCQLHTCMGDTDQQYLFGLFTVFLSTISPLISLVLYFVSFSFFSFFLGFISFTTVS